MSYLKQLLQEYRIRGSVAEIGYFHGEVSTRVFLEHVHTNGGRFYSMDIFPDDFYYEKALSELNRPETRVLKGSSVVIGDTWEGEQLDFLFVDGDHGFPRLGPDNVQSGVALDVLAWHRHLKVGGIMVFHDYTGTETTYGKASLLAVEQAVDSLMVEPIYSFIGRETILVAFRKEREGVLIPQVRQKQAPAEYADAWQSLDARRSELSEFLIYGTGSAGKQVLDCIRTVWGAGTPVAFTSSSAVEPGEAFGCPVIPFGEVERFQGTIALASIHEQAMGEALEAVGKARLKDYYRYNEFVGWCHVGRFGGYR